MSDFTTSGPQQGHEGSGQATGPADHSTPGGSTFAPGLISSSSAPGGARVSEVWADTNDQETTPAAPAEESAPSASVELTAEERRVLGALIEKSYLTPDVYPMTTNALVTASNQKTNRDPVVDYSAVVIDSTLMELRQRNLVRRVHSQGSRSTKHRQTLDEALSLSERELALISVLLLRGPQTIGELRLRTERHDVGFDDLGTVESCLEALASRTTPLVVQLARQPGHKENRWQHLLSAPGTDSAPSQAEATDSQPPVSVVAEAATQAPTADTALTQRVSELEDQVATLQRQLSALATALGEPLE